MQGIKLGEIIRQNRMKSGISAKQLSWGLCSPAALVYYEKGKRIPDSLLFQRLICRMGVSPENFVFMLSREEYDYYRWKEQTRVALEGKDWERLENLLELDEALCFKCNERIQKQYFLFLQGIVRMKQNGDGKGAVGSLQAAAEQTVPGFAYVQNKELLLGAEEVHILILYLYYGLKEEVLDAEAGRRLFLWLEQIIYGMFWEDSEKAKMYPKLVCAWIGSGKERVSAEERIRLCRRAVELLRETHQLYDVTEVLRLYAETLNREKREDSFWEMQYKNFCGIFQEGGLDGGFHPECSWERMPKAYLLGEYLKVKRKKMGMTQKEASEGICEPENYAKLELGYRMPSVKHYCALADRLEIPWGYCRGELDTNDFALLKMWTEERKMEWKEEWEAVLAILEKMEKRLDMGEAVNYQYIRQRQYMAEYRMGRKKAEEVYQKYKELLHMTIPENIAEQGLYCYSQQELELITYMGQLLYAMGKGKEGLELIEKTLLVLKNSGMDIKFQWDGACVLIRGLGRLYFYEQQYQKALNLKRYAFAGEIKQMRGEVLPELLYAMADNLEHLGGQYGEEYKLLYRQAYYITEFFKNF